ncbi:MAG: TonB-dependent receptor [Acidobacteria bacterium]|nr:MAG: TonB-dependent receptor [Acidobacteriota bacterium]
MRLAALFAAFALALTAQAARTTGIVVAGNGLPVAGASVTAGTAHTRTGAQGRFALAVGEGTTLVVTAPGYAATTVTAGAQPLRILLHPAPMTESVTVTATARNQSVAAVPLQTVVMGRARLQAAAPPNVDALLRQFTDLDTFRESGSLSAHPTTQGVSLLGTGTSGASRALVLLDGLPLNDFYGGWVDWLRVPDEDLASISVVSGGASALYGNDALSGVIGLQTRTASATHLDLRTGGGGLGTALADGAAAVVGSKLALAVRGRGIRVGGYVPAANPGAVDRNAGVAAQDWQPVLAWTASPHALFRLSSEYFAENRRNGTMLEVNGTRLRQLALRGIIDNHGVWNGSAFTQSEDFDSTFSSITPDRNFEKLVLQQQVPSLAQGAALDWSQAGSDWSVVAGGSYTHVTAVDNETTPRYADRAARQENGRQRLGGGFAEATWTPRPRWSWTATLRRDGWSDYDASQNTPTGLTPFPDRSETAWSPSLGTVWQARSWLSLRLSGYESFRAPTLNELYRPFRVGNVVTEANPLLAAERYRGAQAGVVAQLTHSLSLHATYFDGTVSNLVTSVTLSATSALKQNQHRCGPADRTACDFDISKSRTPLLHAGYTNADFALITRQRQNLGRVRPRGATLGAQWRPRAALAFWAGYTHIAARVLSAAQTNLVGLAAVHVPQNAFSSHALVNWRGWTLSATERFGGRSFDNDRNQFVLPSFWTTDAFASRTFGRWSPYLAATNLWNRRYAVELTPDAVLNAPRTVTAGLRLTWGAE